METFPIVKRKDEKLYGEYRTRLVPGPGDRAVAHEGRMGVEVYFRER